MTRTLYSVALLLAMTATVFTASAQSVLGALSGTVTDPRGAVLPGARVTAKNNATEQTFKVVTDEEGRFLFSRLPLGTYVIRVDVSGLGSTVVKSISVTPDQAASLSIKIRGYESYPKKAAPPGTGDEPVSDTEYPNEKKTKKDGWHGGETGRDLLVNGRSEVSGYGLYSYILFAGRPTDESKPRYLAVINACHDEIATIRGLENSGLPRNKLNVAYIPIRKTPPMVDPDANWLLDNYDYDRAAALLVYLPDEYTRHQGPYLVSHITPLAADSTGEFLYQDLSIVNERLATAWIKHFLDRASQERYWETDRSKEFALDLRNFVANTAPDIENIKSATASWIQIIKK